MDTTKESAGADVSSAGVQISVGISNPEQFRNSLTCQTLLTGQRRIITGRAGIISRRPEISSSLTGTRMGPEITLGWLNGVMEELCTPLKGTEVMRSGVDPIELGVGRSMGTWCRNIEKC